MIKTTKKILSLILSIVMVISLFAGFEILSVAQDNILRYLTYEIYDGGVTITGCDESINGNIVLPDTIRGYPVLSIGRNAFYNCNGIDSIVIPDSVVTIDDYAFSFCSNITSITLGNGVFDIRNNAFSHCYNLSDITIGNNVERIGELAFEACTNLSTIRIPASVTLINDRAFENCDKLKGIFVDKNNTKYSSDEYGVFFNKDKTKLKKYPASNDNTDYIIPDSVITINDESFANCKNLTNLTFGKNITTIGKNAFVFSKKLNCITVDNKNMTYSSDEQGVLFNKDKTILIRCPEGKTEYIIPDCTITISNEAFSRCTNLTRVTIGKNVTTIGNNAFYFCSSLTEITIPDSVTTIGEGAFINCQNLTSITIPSSVTQIGDFAFGFNEAIGKCSDFEIYGYTNSIAESYANENEINFISIGLIHPSVSDKLEVKNDTVSVDNTTKVSTVKIKSSAKDILKSVKNEKVEIVNKDGKAVTGDALVGTGAEIQIKDNSGKVINTYTVCVPTDVDGNGKTTAADARLALRGSAKLEKIEGVYELASDVDGNGKVTAADARKILRISAGLEKA